HMHGFSSHTLSFWNDKGERVWAKWHLKTNQGIKNVTDAEAASLPSFGAQQDLVDAIDNGDYPSWSVKVQIMTEAEAKNYHINPFDLTKIWPHSDFPLIEIGQLELNRNVENYFAETEQVAFAPNNLVPGIGVSPDRMLQARLLAYQDAHRYRVGANVNQIPVNAPRCPVNHYQRDGAMAGMCPAHGGGNNQGSGVNFYPNDQAAATPDPQAAAPAMPVEADAWIKPHDTAEYDHYSQAGDLYRLMSDGQKDALTATIAGGLVHASASAQERMLAQIAQADADYADRVKQAMANIS
ncbi:MAG TPA: catalase, partial [Candidatus Tenderia electrophaga]|nr:catalase [Candidatus Tenderia electrophaga]